MLGQPLQQLPRQVQPVMFAIGALQQHQHAQAMGVVIPAALCCQCLCQSVLAGVAKGRVADVVGKAQGLGQILVQP